MRLRDNFWLWGHPEGRYNMICGNMKNEKIDRAVIEYFMKNTALRGERT